MMDIKVVKLKDISIGKGEYGIGASSVERNHKLPTYLRITDINDDGSINYNGLTSVDDPNYKKYILKENDIVFARTGASTGRAFFYEQKHGELVYAGFLIKFTLDSRKVIPKFMKYYTQSEIYKGWVRAFTGGSTRGNINAKTYGEMDILLPSTQQQNYLVKVLEQFDDKIEVNNKINENLEELAQALYKHWFVDFEFPNEEGKPYKSSGGKMKESELGLIPEEWEVIKLDNHLNFLRGVEPGAKNYIDNEEKGYIPFYRVGDMLDGSKVKFIKPELAKDRFVNENNTVVSFDGAIGRVSIGLKGAYSSGIRKIYSKEGLLSDSFIYVLFQTSYIQNTINEYANGTTILHASSSIPHLKMVYHEETVKKLEKIINPIVKKIVLNKLENNKLAEMRDLLLPKLMSGEIRIPVKR